jgi:chromosome partitioning protein
VTVLAVVNQKGGVGKTATATNLAAYLGALGARVLLVDCDPQANSTNCLGQRPTAGGLYNVLVRGRAASEVLLPNAARGVDVLPATPDLTGAEIELLDVDDPERRLLTVLAPLRSRYPYIFLDCPPSLGLLTLNALVAADAVLVPVQCEYLALEGLARLMDTLERVRARSNPDLRILGLVMTMYDARTTLSYQVAEEVRRHYPSLIFETVIPRNVRLGEAPSFGQSILEYDPYSRGAQAYQSLALEVSSRVARLAPKVAVNTG